MCAFSIERFLLYFFLMIGDIIYSVPSALPDFYTFQFFGPLILRLFLGGLVIHSGYQNVMSGEKRGGAFELFTGFLLVIGLFTQIAALLLAIMTIAVMVNFYRRGETSLMAHVLPYYILLLGVSIALLFLGPGAFAIDLP